MIAFLLLSLVPGSLSLLDPLGDGGMMMIDALIIVVVPLLLVALGCVVWRILRSK